jgi:hypothetical protein
MAVPKRRRTCKVNSLRLKSKIYKISQSIRVNKPVYLGFFASDLIKKWKASHINLF